MRTIIIRLLNSFGIAMTVRLLVVAWALLGATAVLAAGEPEFAITLRDHQFTPSEIKVPAGIKVKLVVDNQDAGPEEFDSHALNREKVIPGNTKATIFIGPLAPGRYPFIGEFNASTARGEVVAQ
jgi:hypothetical protein